VFYVYILRSHTTGRRYVGSCNDLDDRLRRHNAGHNKATKHGAPWDLVHSETFSTRSEAVLRERYYKTGRGRDATDAVFVLYIRNRADSGALFPGHGGRPLTKYPAEPQTGGASRATASPPVSYLPRARGKCRATPVFHLCLFAWRASPSQESWRAEEVSCVHSRHHLHLRLGRICRAGRQPSGPPRGLKFRLTLAAARVSIWAEMNNLNLVRPSGCAVGELALFAHGQGNALSGLPTGSPSANPCPRAVLGPPTG
jgi:putative endonuclease